MWLGVRRTPLVPAGATRVCGADDTGERRSGRKIRAQGCDREAVRASKPPGLRCWGLTWGSMMLVVPGPWSQRVWAVPVLTARGWPEQPHGRRRQKPSVAGGRQRRQPGRRGLPDRRLVVVVAGGLAAVARARAWVQTRGALVARWRGAAARDHPPGPPPPGQRGPHPPEGKPPRRVQGWAARSDPPGERVEVAWDGGERQQRWGCSRPARWA